MRTRLLLLSLIALISIPAFASTQKTFDATYTATIANVPAGLPELRIWIPLPESRGWQQVSNVQIEAPFPFTRHREKEFGNQYAYAVIPNPPAGDLTIRVKFTATRQEADAPVDKSASRSELQRALRADKLEIAEFVQKPIVFLLDLPFGVCSPLRIGFFFS